MTTGKETRIGGCGKNDVIKNSAVILDTNSRLSILTDHNHIRMAERYYNATSANTKGIIT